MTRVFQRPFAPTLRGPFWTTLLIQRENTLIIRHSCSKGCASHTVNWKESPTPLRWPSPKLGVKKGDRVALLLPNCPQFIIAELGAWKAGATVCPLNPIYTERELEESLVNCAPETIVTLTLFYNRVKSIQPNTKLKRVIATNIKEFLPPVLRLLFTLVKEKKEGHRIHLQPGDLWFSDLLKTKEPTKKPGVSISLNDPAVILLSGGTTGTPKGAVGTHRCLVVSATSIKFLV